MAASNPFSETFMSPEVIPSRETPKTRCWVDAELSIPRYPSLFFHNFKRKRRENAKFELLLQAGSYVWLTYQEAYDAAIRMGSAMRSRGVNPVSATSIEMVLLGVFILQMIR